MKLMRQQLDEVEKGIENLLNAIMAGVNAVSIRDKLNTLEAEKAQLETSIATEEAAHPILTKEQISFFLHRYRETDVNNPLERQRLIDCFVNAVFLYDDKLVLTFNYKDGEKTISLAELEGSDAFGVSVPPKSPESSRFRAFLYF